MNYLKSLMDSAPNSASVMRFAFVNIIVMDYIILFIWIVFCLKAGRIVDIGERVADFAGFINGAGFLGKGVQSFAESKRQPYKKDEGEAD